MADEGRNGKRIPSISEGVWFMLKSKASADDEGSFILEADDKDVLTGRAWEY